MPVAHSVENPWASSKPMATYREKRIALSEPRKMTNGLRHRLLTDVVENQRKLSKYSKTNLSWHPMTKDVDESDIQQKKNHKRKNNKKIR